VAKRLVNTALQQESGPEGMAQHIKSPATWADLVLPAEVVSELKQVSSQAKQSSRASSREPNKAKGLIVLFSGPGGTRKIRAAEAIAGELRLDLYRIDLSALARKYMGETEKILGRLFDTTEATKSVLLFDEADALFGMRSGPEDAHGRYANIEVGDLLKRMEDYDGLVILSTNLRTNIDEAFVRRLQFIIEFPPPSAEDREDIWRRCVPSATRKCPPSKA
jgi:SpoVK/Ycf46/Vps4 family AAA+-type ATPase